jgi:Protein of unknown function (DUF3892)
MPVNYKCVAKRTSGGKDHEHISMLWWVKLVDGKETAESGIASTDQMVQFIENNGLELVWCPDQNPDKPGAWVQVRSNGLLKFVQTVADDEWTNNLLSLPDR